MDTSDLGKTIGGRIRTLREARRAPRRSKSRSGKMTIEHLAEAADLSTDYVNKVELGKHIPTADTIARIANALGVHPGDLFPRTGRQTAKRQALDELLAFASQLTSEQVTHLLEVCRIVSNYPQRKKRRPRKL